MFTILLQTILAASNPDSTTKLRKEHIRPPARTPIPYTHQKTVKQRKMKGIYEHKDMPANRKPL